MPAYAHNTCTTGEVIVTVIFRGTVKDGLGNPIAGAKVTLTSNAGDHVGTTNALGAYTVQGRSDCPATLVAEHSRFVTPPAFHSDNPTADSNVPVDFIMPFRVTTAVTPVARNQTGAPFDVSVDTTAPVSGVVVRAQQANGTVISLTRDLAAQMPDGWYRWIGQIVPPAGTAEGQYTYTACVLKVAGNCATGSNLVSQIASANYFLDWTAPSVTEKVPGDHANTVFTTQPLLVKVAETGSGVSLGQTHFLLSDLTTPGATVDYTGAQLALASGWLKTPATALQVGHNYQVELTLLDIAGNSTAVTWTFRSIAPVAFEGITGSINAGGVLDGTQGGDTIWKVNPSITTSTGKALWPNGSAHAGWGVYSTIIPLAAAKLLVTIDGIEQEWATLPYAATDTATAYQQVAYVDRGGGYLSTMAGGFLGRLPERTFTLPSTVTAVRLVLEPSANAPTVAVAALCADPSTGTAGCSPDPLRFFLRDELADRLRGEEIINWEARTETTEGASNQESVMQYVNTIVQAVADLRDDDGTTWHPLTPVWSVNCGPQGSPPPQPSVTPTPNPNAGPTEAFAVCWLGGMGYPATSTVVLPTDIPSLCDTGGGPCVYTQANQDFDSFKYYCIDDRNGKDYVDDPYNSECSQDMVSYNYFPVRGPYTRMKTYPYTNIKQPNNIFQFGSGGGTSYGMDDGPVDEAGAKWGATFKANDGTIREISWAPAANLPSGWANMEGKYFVHAYPQLTTDTRSDLCPHRRVPIEQSTNSGKGPYGVASQEFAGGNADSYDHHGWRQWDVLVCTRSGAEYWYYGRATGGGVLEIARQVDYYTGAGSHERDDGNVVGSFGHVVVSYSYTFDLSLSPGCSINGCSILPGFSFNPERDDDEWLKTAPWSKAYKYFSNH